MFIQVHSRIRETYPASHNANPLVRRHSPSYQILLKNSIEQATRRHRSQEAISQDDQAPLPSRQSYNVNHNIFIFLYKLLKPLFMKYYHFLVALFTTVMLFIPSCDPNYTGFWYIENQLDEDIIVTRSDSTEIRNVHIKAGDKGCIFQYTSMGSASFFDFEFSFSNPYKPDTLVILNMKLDTLFKLHPENQQDLLNKRFWDFDYWQSLIDHENRTQTLLFILENSYNE